VWSFNRNFCLLVNGPKSQAYQLPVWVMLVEYGCVAAAAAIILMRRIARLAAP
jgi:hypothetical protein